MSPQEVRVLGCLIEKQLTTPQEYPLTLNALTLACNQSSNRDPVVSYDEATVEAAVTTAKSNGLARFVHPSHGRSAIRYAHMLEEALSVDSRQLALLAVMMLRGPQTPGELRSRTERMEQFADLSDLERELERLAQRDEPLVERLPRRAGQKEVRYVHLLGGRPVISEEPVEPGEHVTSPAADSPVHPRDLSPSALEALEHEVFDLRAQVQSLRRDLDDLRSQLGA